MMQFLQVPVEPQPGFMQQYSGFILIAVMFLVMWLFMWRPEAKRRKQMQEFRDGLKKGDKIITAGGIYGTVKEIKETTLLIEVDGGVNAKTGLQLAEAGADILVAGSYVFGAENPEQAIDSLKVLQRGEELPF